jgi:2-oxoglutarate ferredoxin oxidoreductase subunit delta
LSAGCEPSSEPKRLQTCAEAHNSVDFTHRRPPPVNSKPGDSATTTLYAPERRPHREPTIVDFVNIRWVDEWCKRCNICVEICPKDSLILTHDAIIEATDCIRCGLCERFCPDLAIEVLPKRDAEGKLPPEVAAAETPIGHAHMRIPNVARGPAVAGTDPHRGLTDTESAPDVARDNEA